jgi:hypothetical protein
MSRSQALSACSPESTGDSSFAKLDPTSAPLRHVAGFSGLRLLRELRPRAPPSLDSEEFADVVSVGDGTRVPAFRSLTHGPCRRPDLPPGALTTGRNEAPPPHRFRDARRPVQTADPHRAPSLAPSRIEAVFLLRRLPAGVCFLAMDPVVARLAADRRRPNT